MSDPLDDRLASLAGLTLPPLAEARVVMARGDQRRRRTRVASAAAGLVLVLGVAGTAAALTGGDDDALQFAPSPEVSASATPDGLDPNVLLSADDASALLGTGAESGRVRQDPELGLLPCPTGDGYAGDGLAVSHTSPAGFVQSRVVTASSAGSSADLATLVDELGSCPERRDGQATQRFSVQQRGADFVTVRVATYPCASCSASTEYAVVVAAGDLVAYLRVPPVEAAELGSWVDLARNRLTCAKATCP